MKSFDQVFAREVVSRVASLPDDARPAWGTLTRGQLIAHLANTLYYTLGEGPDLPFKGNFLSRTLFKFLILNGFKEIPHNIRLPRPAEVPKDQWFQEGPVEMLREAVDAYFSAVEKGGLPARMHPFFGPLNEKEWRKLHGQHFAHHLRQFGLGQGL